MLPLVHWLASFKKILIFLSFVDVPMNLLLEAKSLPHKSRGKICIHPTCGITMGMLLLLYPMNPDSYVICGSLHSSLFP